MKIWTCAISSTGGDASVEATVHTSREAAYAEAAKWARSWWDEVTGPDIIDHADISLTAPDDDEDAVAMYFGNHPDECCDIREHEIADREPKSSAQIVFEVNQIARRILARAGNGHLAPKGYAFWNGPDPRARTAWAVAVEVYELLTASEVHDALLDVDAGADRRELMALLEAEDVDLPESAATHGREPETNEELCRAAYQHLIQARDLLVRAGASRATDKVRATLKSVDGAVRHARGRDDRAAEAAAKAGGESNGGAR